MRLHYILLLLVLLSPVAVLSQDSLLSHQLNELVVKGERAWIENGTINAIPTKKEKKLSNSPATLIQSMHLPFLKEKDGAIVSSTGETVSIFINGVKADKIDIETFWPMEVKRVQYLENPSNPEYEGAPRAVNFVVDKYLYGGVAKTNLFQRVPNNGIYRASSKMVYKKMTYGALFSGSYERDHRTTAHSEIDYRNFFYKGEKYDEVIREEDSHSYNREDNLQFAFNARYQTENKRITHTASFVWDRNPGSGYGSANKWSDNLFASDFASAHNCYRSLSPSINGSYYFRLASKWHLSAVWSYKYARNKVKSWNVMDDNNDIFNESQEDVNTLSLLIMPSLFLSDKWQFQLLTSGVFDWYSTMYTGSNRVRCTQKRQNLSTYVKMFWNPNQVLSLSFKPGITASFWEVADNKEKEIFPNIEVSTQWNPHEKFNLGESVRFFQRTPSASESNPVMVQSSELMWIVGNPHLKSLTSWDAYFYATYLPSDQFSFSLNVGYTKTKNSIISTYLPATEQQGGLIKQFINAAPSDRVRASIDISGSFFDNNLSVSLTPQWHLAKQRGNYASTFNHFWLSANADYTLGDFRFSLAYDGPYKDLSANGMERSWQQNHWDFSVVYGSGDVFIKFMAENFTNNKAKSWSRFNSPYYSTFHQISQTGRCFYVNLTYTFSFGKKINKSIDIDGPVEVKTSVLKTY